MLESEPNMITINNEKNLSTNVASVTCKNDLLENGNALPTYSPSLAGVDTAAANP